MKSNKLIFIIILSLTLLGIIFYKIDFKKDFVYNLKKTLHPNIIFQLKKIYIYYVHDIKNGIILEKKSNKIIESTLGRKFQLTTYQNKIFKKNGPKVLLKINNDSLFALTGTGILSHTEIENFNKDKVKLKIIRNNLRKIFNIKQIIKNPSLVLDININNDHLYISYVKEVQSDCFNTSVVRAKINLNYMNFKNFFTTNECVNKENTYGEFYILEAGGALEFIDEKMFLSTGAFRFRDLAQLKDNIFGKILLIDINNNSNRVISMGHRNVQGMYYDKKNDILFSIDHGPDGGDEINLNFSPLNTQFKNYGWPIASYGEHYGGKIEANKRKYEKAPLLKSHIKNGFIEPHKFFVPSIAPSNISNIPKSFDKNFTNNIYISSLGFDNTNGRRSVHSFQLNSNLELDNHEIIPLNDRVREIEYSEKINSIFLFLEKNASIAILDKH